jgi:hypothetical protein
MQDTVFSSLKTYNMQNPIVQFLLKFKQRKAAVLKGTVRSLTSG